MEKKIDSRKIREHNRRLIYHDISRRGPLTRQEIVSALSISLPTVNKNLEELMQGGWVKTASLITGTGGRNALSYQAVYDARLALGVSLTGHHINVICMDLGGNILSFKRTRIAFDLSSKSYLKKIGELVAQAGEEGGVTKEKLLGMGVSLPGLLSKDHRKVVYGKTFGFTGITAGEICAYSPYPGELFHDTYTSGYAESRAAPQIKNAFYLILGASVGGALIRGGSVYEGESGKAGEIGHILADKSPNAKTCYCGKKGCFDTLCRAGELDAYTDGNLEEFFERLKEGDGEAKARWERYSAHLAVAVSNLHLIFDMPVIIGGYVGMYMGDRIEDLRRRVDGLNPFGDSASDYVLSCASSLEPIAVGAAQIYIDRFLKESSFE